MGDLGCASGNGNPCGMNVTLFQSSCLGISGCSPKKAGKGVSSRNKQMGKMSPSRQHDCEEGSRRWQHGMGTWEGWGWLSGGLLQLWVLEICMGWHRVFLPLTLAGMLQAPWDDKIQGSWRRVRQSFPWGLQWWEPGHSQNLTAVTLAGAEFLGLTIFSYWEAAPGS